MGFTDKNEIHLLQPRLMHSEPNCQAVVSVVSGSDGHSMSVKGVFRSKKDYGQISWYDKDPFAHTLLQRPIKRDFSGLVLDYDYAIEGDLCSLFEDFGQSINIGMINHTVIYSYSAETGKWKEIVLKKSISAYGNVGTEYPTPAVGDYIRCLDTGDIYAYSALGWVKQVVKPPTDMDWELYSTYPSPQDGWVVMTNYRFMGVGAQFYCADRPLQDWECGGGETFPANRFPGLILKTPVFTYPELFSEYTSPQDGWATLTYNKSICLYDGSAWQILTVELSIDSFADINAKVPNPWDEMYVHCIDTGDVYRYLSGAWVKQAVQPGVKYYEDIAATYPTPQQGWIVVPQFDINFVYRTASGTWEPMTLGKSEGYSGHITIEFDNFYAGWAAYVQVEDPIGSGNFKWEHANPSNGGDWGKVDPTEIVELIWEFLPREYDMVNNDSPQNLVPLDDEQYFNVEYTNWSLTGGDTLICTIPPSPYVPIPGVSVADDIDSNGATPEWLIYQMYYLGFRDQIVFYVGNSGSFYSKKGLKDGNGDFIRISVPSAGYQYVIKTNKPFNDGFEAWYSNYLYWAHTYGYTVVHSISMELVDPPYDWRQLTWNGIPVNAGYDIPVYIMSFTNSDVIEYYKLLATRFGYLSNAAGMIPVVQLGENWYYTTEVKIDDISYNAPGYYDEVTKAKHLADLGYPMPIFKDSGDDITGYEDTVYWLQEQNGDFCVTMANNLKAAYPNAKFTVLVFPLVLQPEDYSLMTRITNFPVEQMKKSHAHFDFIQVEAYDWVLQQKWDRNGDMYDLPYWTMGYTRAETQYFAGYVNDYDYAIRYAIPWYGDAVFSGTVQSYDEANKMLVLDPTDPGTASDYVGRSLRVNDDDGNQEIVVIAAYDATTKTATLVDVFSTVVYPVGCTYYILPTKEEFIQDSWRKVNQSIVRSISKGVFVVIWAFREVLQYNWFPPEMVYIPDSSTVQNDITLLDMLYQVTTEHPIQDSPPTIKSSVLASSNKYLDLTFSEGVYGDAMHATPIGAGSLTATLVTGIGTVTAMSVSSVRKPDSAIEASASPVSGGETTVRIFFSITGYSSGVETIEVKPSGGSVIYSPGGSAMNESQTTGKLTLSMLDLNALQLDGPDGSYITVNGRDLEMFNAGSDDLFASIMLTVQPSTTYVMSDMACLNGNIYFYKSALYGAAYTSPMGGTVRSKTFTTGSANTKLLLAFYCFGGLESCWWTGLNLRKQ
jgi:hypothetical protein